MKIVVVGAGATGAAMGGYLALGGADVTLLDPFEAHMTACREKGLTIQASYASAGSEIKEYNIKIKATTKASDAGIADLVLFMPKGTHTVAAMENANAVSDEHTVLLTLQNGLGNAENIAEYFDPERIACGVTTTSSGLPEPGVVTPRLMPQNHVWIGSDKPHLKEILVETVGYFIKAGLDASFHEDIEVKLWEKFAMNCGVNATTAILRLNPRAAAQYQDYIDIRQEIIREIDNVAKRKGIYMNPNVIFGLGSVAVPEHLSKSPTTYASMAQDEATAEMVDGYMNGSLHQ